MTPMVDARPPLRHGELMDVPIDDVVGAETVAGVARVGTLCEMPEAVDSEVIGLVPKARLVPGSTSSVAPRGIPVLVDDVAVDVADIVDVPAAAAQIVGVGNSAEVPPTDEALMPPPSKVEPDPPIPVLTRPVVEQPPPLTTPSAVGPRPPGLISVAPKGMPVGPAGARGEVINAGELGVVV